MARNGSGTYSRVAGTPYQYNTVIDQVVVNSELDDIATALTASLAKDGQTTPTATLPMGTFRHTGVGAAAARTDYARAAEVQDGAITKITSVAGTNTITASAPISMAAYAVGQEFTFIPAATNTGAATLNINSIGAGAVQQGGKALVGGELKISVPVRVLVTAATPVFEIIGSGALFGPHARADIASATTLDLDATLTHSLNVTGTTPTTGITLADGAYRILLANAAWPITHGASLICPGSASYTCAAGDLILAIGEPAGVVRLAIWKADGTAVVGAARQACVSMIRTANSTNDTLTSAAWKVYDETGTEISTAGTTTDGLQEAINYAARYGYDLRVWGGGLKPAYWGQAYGGALGNNPFTTANASNVVTVTHAAHGRVTGDKMTFNGMTALVNNIPEANFAVELPITKIDANSYTVALATNANANGAAGGAACRWQDSGQDVAIIACSTGIIVPPIQGVNWEIHATINFGGAGGTDALAFDSIMASEIKITDQIVCASGYPVGVSFKPTKELPQDPNGPVVTSCRVYLPSVVMLAAAGACVSLDCTNGDIADAVFDIIEPNGGAYGVRSVFAATHGVRSNKIRINGAHDQTSALVSVGLSATGAANSYGNQWEIQGHPAAAAVGVDIWGVNDHFVIDIDSAIATPTIGVKFEPSASGNVVVGHRVDGTTLLQDASTDKSNTFIGAKVAASVHRNAVDQTAVATATWTKVQFTTEVFDAGGKFDSATNYRWTPGRVGMALISANVAWVTAVDATLAGIAIYKNGAVHREEYTYMSGSGGSQGPSITALVLVDAQTDYFEIFVRQDSGGNRDIAGSVSDTFAMFMMQP